MKNKHAFLIGVYKDPKYLEILLSQLISERSNIYVHVNKRNWSEFEYLNAKYKDCHVTFIHSVTVNWGGSSFLKSVMELLRLAIQDDDNVYFHFITGQDILIKPIKELFSFFENKTESYLSFKIMPQSEVDHRFNTYHLFDMCNINYSKKNIKLALEILISKIQRFVRLRHQGLPFKVIYQGSSWFSLHRSAVIYCMKYIESNNLIDRFKHTYAPDETVFQSILLEPTSGYNVVNNKLRYIVWDFNYVGAQKLLTLGDFDDIMATDAFFARKVDYKTPQSNALIKKILEYTGIKDNTINK